MTRILALLLALSFSGCAFENAPETGDSTAAVSGRPYFDLFEATNGDWYFNLKAANHQVILSSQGYSTRTSALNGVLSTVDNGENEARFDVREASNGEFYFNLKSRNGRIIGSSETYTTLSNARRGVQGVVRNVGEYLGFMAGRTGARFQTFQGADDRFYFSLYAANGEIVLQSQGYAAESTALNATFSVADNGLNQDRYDINEASNGGFYFNLKAANGRTIGTSEVYSTRSNAQRGCDTVIALLPEVDLL